MLLWKWDIHFLFNKPTDWSQSISPTIQKLSS